MKKQFLLIFSFFIFFFLSSQAKELKNLKPTIPIPKVSIGPLDYQKLNFNRGVYKTVSGPDRCIEGEYRLLKDPDTGRVFLKTNLGIFINHIDQKVVNQDDSGCVLSYFNTINQNNELENTEIQSCTQPVLVSNIRTLRIKFDTESIKYVLTTNDPVKKIKTETNCELSKEIN